MSTDLEKKIIGSCFSYPKCLDQAMDKLKKKHFIEMAPVFEAIRECYNKGNDYEDLIFDVQDRLDSERDFFPLINLAQPSINELIDQLINRWQAFEADKVSKQIYEIAPKGKYDNESIEDTIIESIHRLSSIISDDNDRQQTMDEVMNDTVALIDRLRSGETLGFQCGLDIDQVLQGFQKGLMYLLAARPSMGKTALAIQIAQQVSRETPVGFLSLETTNKSLGLRHLVNHAGLNGSKIRAGYVNDEDFGRVLKAADALSGLPIITDDTTDITAQGLRSKVNRMKRKHGIEFLIIDYMQLMKADRNSDTREQQVAEISKACVSVAKDFDLCILGLAQLSRANERRGGDKRPILSDLRESGQLEQDAFSVLFLHRPEYYGVETYQDGRSTKGIAEIIVAKHKDGPTGVKELLFDDVSMRFKNLSRKDNMVQNGTPF